MGRESSDGAREVCNEKEGGSRWEKVGLLLAYRRVHTLAPPTRLCPHRSRGQQRSTRLRGSFAADTVSHVPAKPLGGYGSDVAMLRRGGKRQLKAH